MAAIAQPRSRRSRRCCGCPPRRPPWPVRLHGHPSPSPPPTTTSAPPVVPPPTTLPPTTLPPPPPPPPTTTTPTTPPTLPVPVAPPLEDGNEDPELQIGSIEIPRIGLERSMYEGIRLSTLDRGPGHWPGTAMPGEFGNVVVAGHRVSHNEDFRNLVAGARRRSDLQHRNGSAHVPRAEHGGRRTRRRLDRRPDPCPDRNPVRVPSSGIDSAAHRRASRTRSLSQFALALASGFPGRVAPRRGVGGRWRSSASPCSRSASDGTPVG